MARQTRSTAATSRSRSRTPKDAIALLEADHREVEGWFAQFEKTKSAARKQDLAGKICKALKVHTQIEDEIFYPAFLEATEDEAMHHEAVIEHDTARKLIAEIEASSPDEEYYGAKVKVLSELIEHHVEEEEERGGMFAEAKQSEIDRKSVV